MPVQVVATMPVATLSYAYAEGLVVLEDLTPEAHPMVHDLCRQHAEGLRVPLGWDLATSAGATVDLRATDRDRHASST